MEWFGAGFPVWDSSSNINMRCEENSNRSMAKLSKYLCGKKYEIINIMLLEFLITWKMLSEMLPLSEKVRLQNYSFCYIRKIFLHKKEKDWKEIYQHVSGAIFGWWNSV